MASPTTRTAGSDIDIGENIGAKLQTDQAVVHQATRATAQLWIESPLDREEGHKGAKLNSMFDTHPPLEERIALLREL